MSARPSLVATCPDCGGILQPVGQLQLTSAEVAGADTAGPRTEHLQCLICGYGEDRVVADEHDEVTRA
jgi:hypothetical protein